MGHVYAYKTVNEQNMCIYIHTYKKVTMASDCHPMLGMDIPPP